jgi:dTDP-L-rhamnose 4-epimerase
MQAGDFNCKCPVCQQDVALMPTSESSKIHPTSIYGITKQNQEQMVLTACQSLGIDAVAFRYQNVYGPGQSLSNPYTGILSIFSTQIRNGNNINIFEDGEESRDFVYIDDVVDATILGLEKKEANTMAFNVGSDTPVSVMTVAKTLRDFYDVSVEIQVTGKFRIGDIRHNFADLSTISSLLGYTPKVTFKEGIKKFTDWVKNQPVNEDNYDTSIAILKDKGLFK